MAIYNLSGRGVQDLTSGTSRLFIAVTTFPGGYSIGRASPNNLYDIGLLRIGVQGSFYPSVPIDADSIVLDLPNGSTQLGYALFGDGAIQVSEGTQVPPPTAFVRSDADGLTKAPGDTVTITWGNLGLQATSLDWVTITPVGVGVDKSIGIFKADRWAYTNSCSTTAGTTQSTSGSCTGTFQNVPSGSGDYECFLMDNDTDNIKLQTGVVIVVIAP